MCLWYLCCVQFGRQFDTPAPLLDLYINVMHIIMRMRMTSYIYRSYHAYAFIFTERSFLDTQMLSKQFVRKVYLDLAPTTKFCLKSSATPDASTTLSTTVECSETVKPFSEIPGPKPLPIIRNILDFRRNSDRLIYFLEECYKKYGGIFKLEVPGWFGPGPCGKHVIFSTYI